MRESAENNILIATRKPQEAIAAALRERGWLVEEACNLIEAQQAFFARSHSIVLLDVAFYRVQSEQVSSLRASASPRASYFIVLSDSEDDALDIEDVALWENGAQGIARRVQQGFRYLEMRERAEKAENELLERQREAAKNEAFSEGVTKQLIEMTAMLQGEAICNLANEAERINTAKMDTILQATATLRHKIFNPLFAIQANTEGALRHLNFWLESGVSELAPIIEKLDCVLQGSDRIQKVVETFSKLVVPTTQDYLPGMQMLALEEEVETEAA